jgi:hypothetical protein
VKGWDGMGWDGMGCCAFNLHHRVLSFYIYLLVLSILFAPLFLFFFFF